MAYDYFERCEQLIKHWWLSLIIGLAMLAMGLVVLVNPTASYLTFALWLGVLVALSGVVGIVQGVSSKNYFVRRGWLIVASIADIIIGILLMFNIALSAALLPVLLGVWLLYRGMTLIMQGADLRNYRVRDAGWVIFGGALIVAISLAVLFFPLSVGVEAVVLAVSIGFIVYGFTTISLSFRLYDVHRRAKALR
ncbi:MAG: DUF308 domain-containing protein [Alistipes sp.]|nr:DUF308 domain-containing protein [Alistipes sp.]